MLQIITGKFFDSDERHISDQKGILYSNYRWHSTIKTWVGTLEPLCTRSTLVAYLFSFRNQLEKKPGGFEIVRAGDGQIIEQFRLLCSFGLRATFAEDRSRVAHLCRSGTVGQSDAYAPSQLLPRYFATEIQGSPEESAEFSALICKTLELSRSDFTAIITAIQAFNGALEVVGSSLDLAYSMLVYALESLSKKYISYTPSWSDFDERTRLKLDPLLADLKPDISTSIKEALLSNAHLKLRSGFQEFICTHVEDSFFTSQAATRTSPLQEQELRRAARNIYDVRSKYVHELTPLMHQLHLPEIAVGDVFRWERQPHLTFCGLVHLADHVIRTLIKKLPKIEKEKFNWRDALPGIVRLNMAPQYWIHQVGGFNENTAHRYLSDFLEHLLTSKKNNEPICDMTLVMEKIESIARRAKPEPRRSMLALYLLYNGCLYPEFSRPNWEQFFNKHSAIFDEPCIEIMAVHILLNEDFPWKSTEENIAIDHYRKNRFNKGFVNIPLLIEITINSAVANKALQEGNIESYLSLAKKALLNSAGLPKIQRILNESISNQIEIPLDIFINHKAAQASPNRQADIEASAYFNYLSRKDSNIIGDELSDWLRAEKDLMD